MMYLTTYQNATAFLAKAEAVFLQDEAKNSLILGIALKVQAFPERYQHNPPYLATVEDEQGIVTAAVMTPPHKLLIYGARQVNDEAFALIARNLHEQGRTIPGVNGIIPLSETFARVWKQETGEHFRLAMNMRLFALTQVLPPVQVTGRLRLSHPEDLALISQWVERFWIEADHKLDATEAAQETARRRIGKDIYVWELPDGTVTTMAASNRPLHNTISVSLVYTPPEHRGNGYASNCVATLSQLLLDQGWKYCNLFTDLSNPTSNSIYQKIGYRPVCDYADYTFSVGSHS